MEDDRRLRTLEGAARECGRQLRDMALLLDADPGSVVTFAHSEVMRLLQALSIPREYSGAPVVIDGEAYYGDNCLERVVALEGLAYGDAGAVLAAPGPSLAGQLVADLGDSTHKERFYRRFEKGPTWSFFAMTEPGVGSDASAMTTRLYRRDGEADSYYLRGEKLYIGNGCRGTVGVVFARSAPAPLAIESVLVEVEQDDPSLKREPVETLGLRAVQLGRLTFRDLVVDGRMVLGRHLSGSRRGMAAAVRTLNRMRPAVAALALGLAQAVFDHLLEERRRFSTQEEVTVDMLRVRLSAARALLRKAAQLVDMNPDEGSLASASKVVAVRVAEAATTITSELLGPGALVRDPLLNKWYRDARGFEYMEGTSHIQKLNVFQGYLRRRLPETEVWNESTSASTESYVGGKTHHTPTSV